MRRIPCTVIILLGHVLTACTDVTVRRVTTGNEPGIRYFLPQPVLSVTPLENGSMDVRTEILADRSETYAMEATSYLASHKVIMKLNKGLLTEVTLNQDSSAVAAEAVKATGEIAKTKIETETAARTAAQKKEEEALQKKRDELKNLEDSLDQAKIELDQAQKAKEALLPGASDADKQAAAVVVAKAQAKKDYLEGQLQRARSDLGSFSTVKKLTRPGPVLFAIKDDSCGFKNNEGGCEPLLKLVPLNFEGGPQKTFDIYQAPDASKGQADNDKTTPGKIEFEGSSLGEVQVGSSPVKVEIKTKTVLLSLKAAEMKGSHGKLDPQQLPVVKGTTNKQIFELQFKPHTPPDGYTIKFIGVFEDGKPEIDGSLTVKVIP
jgi:hypothetical protein